MDVEFLNSYTEVVLENFDAVLKQNLMFQTQLKIVEKRKGEKDELIKRLEEKDKLVKQLENTIASMQNDVSFSQELKKRVVDNDTILNERNRIQQALNDNMQQNANLQKKLNQKELDISKINEEVLSLKDYISKLEEVVPVTKLKKIAGIKVEPATIVDDLNEKEKLQSGGTF